MDCKDKLIAKAVSQIGHKEPTGDDVYIKWYNKKTGSNFGMSTPWCAIFVSWCFDAAGLSKYCKPSASCTAMFGWFKAAGNGFFRETGKGAYVPKPGDVVFYDWNPGGNDGPDHVGIISKIIGGMLQVVEGNYSDAVKTRWIDSKSNLIYGYGVPAFPTGDVNGDGKVDAADAKEILKTAVKKSKKATVAKADVDGDGKVTAADAKEVLKKAVKKS